MDVREKLVDLLDDMQRSGTGYFGNAIENKKIVDYLISNGVAPVWHARWVEYQIPPIICCSNCDWATGIEEKNFQHCPNCGAKMDGELNE